jgi:Dullard-like phosphatase family protein
MDSQANPALKEIPSHQKFMVTMQPKSMGHFKRPKYHRGESKKNNRATEVIAIAKDVLDRDSSLDAPNWTSKKQSVKDSKILLQNRIQMEGAAVEKLPSSPIKHAVSAGNIKTVDLKIDVLGQHGTPNFTAEPVASLSPAKSAQAAAESSSQAQLKPLQKMFLEHKLPIIYTPTKHVKPTVFIAKDILATDHDAHQPSYFSSRQNMLPKIFKRVDNKDLSERKIDSETPKIKVLGSSSKNLVKSNSSMFQISVSKSKAISDRPVNDGSVSSIFLKHRLSVAISPLKSQTYYLSKLDKSLNSEDLLVKMEYNPFAEHLAKNFIEMRALKQDKLLVDYHTKPVQLPPSVHTNLLVLDLDETLVHCVNFDGRINSTTESVPFRPLGAPTNSAPGLVKFNRRPGLEKFLKSMAEHFQIVVFTASDRAYARAVLNQIDPDHHVCKLLCRESCSFTKTGNVVKDLRLFYGKQLHNIILVDNSTKCFYPQIDNGIPILSFIDDQKDTELEELSQFLIALKRSGPEMTKNLRDYFQLYRNYTASSHTQMAREIFGTVDAN